ncbi:sensor histidine kinase [Dethiobacter alkaliphilus]|uniref:sensor histidine kinase n=1 Tax=Dethiobacter alkaliphilus TaxID=427926 RepID=UPI002227927E|nr:HAMP domain-containing sensor histidine kinase [Dethiobacter alkaliphilus]MCW3489889.1 HAMP domain-containing histidine kinase [Dethiobacter alkaliphilus]
MIIKWGPKSLFAKLLAAHMVVIMVTLATIGFLFSYLVDKYFFSAREWELTAQAEQVAELLAAEFQAGNFPEVEKMSETLAVSMDVKVRVMDDQRNEIVTAIPPQGESTESVALDPDEIDFIMQGDVISKKVYGPAVQHLLVGMPIFKGENGREAENPEVIGGIIVNAPLASLRANAAQISSLVLYSLLFATLVAGFFAFNLAKTISRPLQAMTSAAMDMKSGNFRNRIDINDKGELGQLAATFNQAVEETNKTIHEQKRLQALRQNLVASVSHEFRAPLTSIQGFVDAMLEGFIREEEQEKYLRVILNNTLHLNRLVNDLVDLASIESGYVQLRYEDVDPYTLAEKALDSVYPQAQEKSIKLEYNYEEGLPALRGDGDRLYQILINLLENAITYTPDKGRIALEAQLSDDKEKVIFTVKDNGQGIPSAEIPYIWERFYKVDKARNRANKGKGLGLAIVRELVHMHNGEVAVKSTPGEGSAFSVVIPIEQKEDEKSPD